MFTLKYYLCVYRLWHSTCSSS